MGFIVSFGLFLVILSPTNCLECGINSGLNTTELKILLTTCMSKEKIGIDRNNKNKTENNDYSNENDDSYFYNDDFLEEKVNKTETDFNKNENNNKKMTTTEDFSDMFNHPGRCTYHCIFKKLHIADEDGFPDHDKVSQHLIIEAKNKELKDFFQDSIDECFQLTQDEELEVCDFSYNFFKCLAEKARENCSDWPLEDPLLFDLF